VSRAARHNGSYQYGVAMGHVLDAILRLPPPLALVLVFLLPALEASAFVGVVLPGEIGVILGGVLANQHKLSLVPVLIAAIAGAIIGDSIGYWVGQRYGESMLAKVPNRILKPEHVERAQQTIRQFGGRAVFLGRFTAALRALVPGMAGLSRVPYGRFLAWNALGGIVWASSFVVLGYLAGSQYHRIEHYANYIGLALLVAIFVFLYVRHRRQRPAQERTGT
jgi:membrane-associated protein